MGHNDEIKLKDFWKFELDFLIKLEDLPKNIKLQFLFFFNQFAVTCIAPENAKLFHRVFLLQG